MKRFIFTLLSILSFCCLHAQTTYYWVGGTTDTTADFRAKTNWSTTLGGAVVSGTGNISLSSTVSLVYDGSNLGTNANAAVAIMCNVNGGTTISQLRVINGAKVIFQRAATTGTTTFIVNGDNTTQPDFVIGASSAVTILGSNAYGLTVQLGPTTASAATGTVAGTLNVSGNYTNRLYVQAPGAMVFAAGSSCYVSTAGSTYYPLGVSVASADKAVVFQAGSSLVYQGGNCVFGNITSFNAISMEAGSNFVFEAANAVNMFASRYYSNVIIRNGATVTSDGAFYNIDSLTIVSGAAFYLNPVAQSPVSGSIVNNGTLGVSGTPTSSVLVMNGSAPKTIGGTGTYTLHNMTIGSGAPVTLNTNISIAGNLLVQGVLNLQAYAISGAGSFETRAAETDTVTGTLTEGSYTIPDVTPGAPVVAIGTIVTGTGIQPNTYLIYSLSNGTWTLSKPATASGTDVTLIATRTTASIFSSSAAGIDGNLALTGTRTFNAGTSYVFNTPTLTPFPAALAAATAADVAVNSNVTLNKNLTVNGTLSLLSGNLTIPPSDTLRIASGNSIAGSGFAAAKHVVTQVNTSTGEKGVLRMDNVSGTQLFPIGSTASYLPVTLTPTVASTYYLTAFQGITTNGAPNGAPFATAAAMVNAVWDINRPSSAAPCTVSVAWPASLEGAAFSSYANGQVGIAHYNGSSWDNANGSGDNIANTATSGFTAFSPFAVGQLGTPLALSVTDEKATVKDHAVLLSWKGAQQENTASYSIERAADGKTFQQVATLETNGAAAGGYSWEDHNATANVLYYRIKGISKTGTFTYSKTLKVEVASFLMSSLSAYPNPAKDQLNIEVNGSNAVSVTMVDLTGKKLGVFTLHPGRNAVDLTDRIAGSYFLLAGNGSSVSFTIAK